MKKKIKKLQRQQDNFIEEEGDEKGEKKASDETKVFIYDKNGGQFISDGAGDKKWDKKN